MTNNKTLGLQVGLAAGICYLAAHALIGQQGLLAFMDLQAQEHALEAQRDALAAQREALEARAERMRLQSLDRDYLEERARVLLGAARQDEIVFTRPTDADQS